MVEITSASLYCRKTKASDALQISHARTLQSSFAKYPVQRVEVKTFTVPCGVYSVAAANRVWVYRE